MGVHACSGAPPVVVVTCEAPLGLQVIFSLLSTSFLLLLQATNPSHLPTSSLPLLFLCCSIIAAVGDGDCFLCPHLLAVADVPL
jgi:hypothetical protein